MSLKGIKGGTQQLLLSEIKTNIQKLSMAYCANCLTLLKMFHRLEDGRRMIAPSDPVCKSQSLCSFMVRKPCELAVSTEQLEMESKVGDPVNRR